MTVTIYNTSNHTTEKVVGYCKLAALVFAMKQARKLDPSAKYVDDMSTVYIHVDRSMPSCPHRVARPLFRVGDSP